VCLCYLCFNQELNSFPLLDTKLRKAVTSYNLTFKMLFISYIIKAYYKQKNPTKQNWGMRVQVYFCNFNTLEAEAGGSQIQGHLGYTATLRAARARKILSLKTKAWRFNSVIECLPSMCKVLGSLHSTSKNQQQQQTVQGLILLFFFLTLSRRLVSCTFFVLIFVTCQISFFFFLFFFLFVFLETRSNM
jgi:hypothetical protein